MTSTSPEPVTTFWTVISLFVSVPVLSEQITDAEPSVSTDESRFTIARCRAIRCTPKASTTESTAGSPSGTAATASATPTSSTETTSEAVPMSAVSRIAVTTTTAIAITATPSMRPIRSTSTLERRALLAGAAEEARDSSHLRRHPGRGHDRTPATARDGGAAEDHVHAVAELDRAVERRDVLQHGLALPRQRRLGDGQRVGLEQTAVRGDRVTLREQQDVAGHHLGRGDPLLAPVAEHAGRRRGQPLQRGHRLLGTRLLHVAEHGIREDDRSDHDRVVRRSLAALQHPGDQRDHDRREQQVDQRVGELPEELPPLRHTLRRLEPVRAEPLQPRPGLRPAKAAARVGRERRSDLVPVALPRLRRQARRGRARPSLDVRNQAHDSRSVA